MDVREKLVELIGSTEYGNGSLVGKNFQKGFIEKIASNLIANGVTVQEWIPVAERLPKHGEVILCHLTCDELRILQWDNIYKWFLGYGSGDDWQQKNVTHWMPLPPAAERRMIMESENKKAYWEQGDYYDIGDVCSNCDYDSCVDNCREPFCPCCGAEMVLE